MQQRHITRSGIGNAQLTTVKRPSPDDPKLYHCARVSRENDERAVRGRAAAIGTTDAILVTGDWRTPSVPRRRVGWWPAPGVPRPGGGGAHCRSPVTPRTAHVAPRRGYRSGAGADILCVFLYIPPRTGFVALFPLYFFYVLFSPLATHTRALALVLFCSQYIYF